MRAGSRFWMAEGVVYEPRSIIIHSSYNPRTVDFDFSLIKVNGEFYLSPTTQVIHLPVANSLPPVGAFYKVSGWGLTKDTEESRCALRRVTVQHVTSRTSKVHTTAPQSLIG